MVAGISTGISEIVEESIASSVLVSVGCKGVVVAGISTGISKIVEIVEESILSFVLWFRLAVKVETCSGYGTTMCIKSSKSSTKQYTEREREIESEH